MIRQIASHSDCIFLTFDDGPDERHTAKVLDILGSAGARATFFMIGERLARHKSLVERMVSDGHALGNHSWDHRFRNYFLGRSAMRRWITNARAEFARLRLPEPVGFRPPAGVITPVVKRVVRELDEPLVLWNERFYDRVHPWTAVKAGRSAERLEGGSVVLLHDRRRHDHDADFLNTLELYIERLRGRGFRLEALTRAMCHSASR